jgi:hypothetical protein
VVQFFVSWYLQLWVVILHGDTGLAATEAILPASCVKSKVTCDPRSPRLNLLVQRVKSGFNRTKFVQPPHASFDFLSFSPALEFIA